MTMTSTRMNRVGRKILVLCVLAAAGAAQSARAQGFGADPFRPYNNQYDAFTLPLGSSAQEAAQSAAMMRSGLRGANQFENYLAEIQGLGRSGAEKYGQGLPYFRSAIDPTFAAGRNRDYRPNRTANRSFEETQQRLTAKYLAYFEERDPKKRGRLLREYQQYRRESNRALSGRRDSLPGLSDSADRADSAERDRPATRERDADAVRNTTRSGGSRLRSSDLTSPNTTRSTPPPPRRSGRPLPSASSPRTPSEVLERARRLDGGGTSRSSRGSATGGRRDSRLPPDGTPSGD
jgi:hypothetical protein